MTPNWNSVKIDGKKIQNVTGFKISYRPPSPEVPAVGEFTIEYLTGNGKRRLITCELEAVSFGAE